MTVNLAPADLPKEGGRYDLAVALGILAASGQLQAGRLEGTEFYGELSLSGELRPVRGLLAASAHAARAGRQLVVPRANAEEARVAPGARVAGATTLTQVRNAFSGGAALEFAVRRRRCRRARPRRRTWPTCVARPAQSARSRLRQRARTACFSSVRRAPARA